MSNKIILASHNQGKLREFQQILSAVPALELLGADDLETTKTLNPEETGITFAENASLKARAFARASGLPALADDSGICIPALGGFPGVFSARWLSGTDQDRAQGLLQFLNYFLQVSTSETIKYGRAASYAVSLCYFDPVTQVEKVFTGECNGTLGIKLRGEGGFGYDPLFIPDLSTLSDQSLVGELQGLSFGELKPQIKNEISHRRQALKKFQEYLSSLSLN